MALEFSVQVEQWVQQAKGRGDQAFQAIVLDAVNDVKARTPVRTGFLRANWTVVRNDDPEPVARADVDVADVIAQLQIGDRITIVNPVVYAARVNYGFVGEDSLGRHYDQKGQHMMEQTIAALPEIAQRAVERVRSGPVATPETAA